MQALGGPAPESDAADESAEHFNFEAVLARQQRRQALEGEVAVQLVDGRTVCLNLCAHLSLVLSAQKSHLCADPDRKRSSRLSGGVAGRLAAANQRMLNEMNRLRGRRVHKASVRNAEASRQEGIRDGARRNLPTLTGAKEKARDDLMTMCR